MKRTLMLAFFALIANVAFSQQDQKAKTILEDVTATTQSNFPIQASFDYVLENKEEGIYEENKGILIIDNEKYQLKLPTLGLEMYCNGTYTWTYMVDAEEVTISEIDEDSEDMADPSKLFTIYENGFDYKFVGEKTVDGTAVYMIDLIPTMDDIEYSKISIQIDKDKSLIKNAEMISDGGNSYIFNVTDLKTNVSTTESTFMFDESSNPDVYVIDLR